MLKKVKNIRLFFSQRSQRSYGNRLIVEIVGIARIAEPIFQRFWRSSDPSDYMEPGLKNSGENEGGLTHQMLLVQLSSEKKSSF